jgi:osmotically inducible lipoprotein OsmB
VLRIILWVIIKKQLVALLSSFNFRCWPPPLPDLWPALDATPSPAPHYVSGTPADTGGEIVKLILAPLLIVGLLGTAGCSNMSSTEQRTLSGGAIGAAGGAIGGALTGCAWCGAAIGGAVGAGAGYLYDQTKKGNL